MKEKPIIFSGEMVRAILDGRKTMTRRVIKPQPHAGIRESVFVPSGLEDGHGREIKTPYRPDDRLWVREAWADLIAVSPATDKPIPIGPGERLIDPPTRQENGRWHYDGKVIAYRANSNIEFCDGDGFSGELANRSDMPRWRPSIHMPRWASRITLEVVDVRVERVQDISEEDATAEGIEGPIYISAAPPLHSVARFAAPGVKMINCYEEIDDCAPAHDTAREAFACLWDSINAKRGFGWGVNPWVWVIEFRRIEGEA